MSILDSILQNPQLISQIAGRIGVDPHTATTIVQQIAPALAGGLHTQLTGQGDSADAVKTLVQDGTHQTLVTDPATVAQHNDPNGQALVGRLLGPSGGDMLANHVSDTTGIHAGTLKDLLPTLAAIVVGAASQEVLNGGGMKGLIRGLAQNPQTSALAGGLVGVLTKTNS